VFWGGGFFLHKVWWAQFLKIWILCDGGRGDCHGGGGVWTVHARKFWCIGARARCRKNGLCTAWARLEVGRYGLKPSISVAIECACPPPPPSFPVFAPRLKAPKWDAFKMVVNEMIWWFFDGWVAKKFHVWWSEYCPGVALIGHTFCW